MLEGGICWDPVGRAHGALAPGWGTGLTGQMEHESEGSEYLKENSCMEELVRHGKAP